MSTAYKPRLLNNQILAVKHKDNYLLNSAGGVLLDVLMCLIKGKVYGCVMIQTCAKILEEDKGNYVNYKVQSMFKVILETHMLKLRKI